MKPLAAFVTFDNYRNFHGMLCHPTIAQRCVESFTGTILFLPHDYTSPADHDFTRPLLTVFTYYLLVLLSLTGWSTLLGGTTCHCAEGDPDPRSITTSLASRSDPSLVFRKDCWDYIYQQSNCKTLKLSKRLEYEFLWGNLSVVMLHLVCENKKLHLVEVYRWKVPVIGAFFKVVFDVPSWLARRMVRRQEVTSVKGK